MIADPGKTRTRLAVGALVDMPIHNCLNCMEFVVQSRARMAFGNNLELAAMSCIVSESVLDMLRTVVAERELNDAAETRKFSTFPNTSSRVKGLLPNIEERDSHSFSHISTNQQRSLGPREL